jgi:hypothetical protein
LNVPDNNYGTLVTVNAPSQGASYEFAGIVVDGKVTDGLTASFRIYEDTVATVYYKPVGSQAIIVKDTNNDQLVVVYTETNGVLSSASQLVISSLASPTKPGLAFSSWSVTDFTVTFTEDAVVYPLYTTAVNDLSLNLINGVASVEGPYSFNQVLTVNANGTGTFKYWLKDGRIASLDETYTFTIAKAHELEAVYDTDFVANTGSFVGISDVYDNLRSGYYTVIGNIDLATGEELVEWGIITSDLPGGITLDTPGVEKYNSNKLNSGTNEFVMSFVKDSEVPNYRAFVTTINGTTVKTVYSYIQDFETVYEYASDLIISEYGEGSSNNKWIEIYNRTGSAVDLSIYSLALYSNGSPTAGTTVALSGTLASGDVYVVYNAGANATVIAAGDLSSTVTYFNGDDAVALLKNGTAIDVFGVIGTDPGTAWTWDGGTTLDRTLVRKSTVTGPTTTWNSAEWDVYATDTFTYVGFHTMTLSSSQSVLIITDYAFSGCSTLSSVYISQNISSIGWDVFVGCFSGLNI